MIWLIVMIFLAVLVFVLAGKLLSNVFKLVATVMSILLIVLVVFGFFIVKDARDLGSAVANNEVLYVLERSNETYAAFYLTGLNMSSFTPAQNIDAHEGYTITVNESFLIKQGSVTNIPFETLETGDFEERSQAFMVLYLNTAREKGPLFFFDGLQQGTLSVSPSGVMVALIQRAPEALIASAKEQITVPV
jgi:energy-coupling factor transporter transmembrane protein EcfT